ncbi:IS3 family transposase [Enterococcus faecalis]|uniref:IS3 family transposase n=1 Tax=Enterococcus faecalis TaxID=1351 RepID=UPI0031CD7871
MKQYKKQLTSHQIFQSMSRKVICFDNSPVENFFGLLKLETYHGTIYSSFEELEQAIEEGIDYNNHQRIKTKLGRSPIKFHERLVA